MTRRVLLWAAPTLLVLSVLGLWHSATAQPVTTGGRFRMRTDCTTGYGLTWNGSTWACTQVLAATSGRYYYTGSVPTLSVCTATCTIASYSTDHRGIIACTDYNSTDCTVTFTGAWSTNAPSCVITSTEPAVVYFTATPTTTAFGFKRTTSGVQTYHYHCDGML